MSGVEDIWEEKNFEEQKYKAVTENNDNRDSDGGVNKEEKKKGGRGCLPPPTYILGL